MNDPFNFVTSFDIIKEIKNGSKYFVVNLGYSATVESKSGERTSSDKDQFSFFYNSQYETIIYGQGNIGNIRFYTDHYIKEDVIAVYYNFEEFIIPYNRKLVKESGIDAMIGEALKIAKDGYEDRKIDANRKKEDQKNIKKGNKDIIYINPGAVRYEDLKAYLEKRKEDNKI